MSLNKISLKQLSNETPCSKHIPMIAMVDQTIVELENGELLATIKLDGIAFQTEVNEYLNNFHMIWHQYLTQLDDRFCVYVTMQRKKISHQLCGKFTGKFLKELNKNYWQQFKNKGIYQNDIYLTIIYRGMSSGKVSKGVSIFHRISRSWLQQSRILLREKQSIALRKQCNKALSVLKNYNPRLLGSMDESVSHSELLDFCGLIVNGGRSSKLKFSNHFSEIHSLNNAQEKFFSRYPYGNVSQYLAQHQLLFGDCICFRSSMGEDKFAAILSLKNYPNTSASILLSPLLQVDAEWLSTHSYSIESNDVVIKRIKQHATKLKNVNDHGHSQISYLDNLLEQLQSGDCLMGNHHHSLMVYGSSPDELDNNITCLTHCYLEAGIPVVRESLGLEVTFWAQIPGNMQYIARSSLITSENFSDFCPLHNCAIGYKDNNHLGSAVTLLSTSLNTPFFFNFHLPGSKDNPSPGHTVILGSNGSGKTVLLTFLDAQLSRYQGISVFLDRNRGAEIYIRACGGYYAILSPDRPDETCFNPFLSKDTPGQRRFCLSWLEQLCKSSVDSVIDSQASHALKNCVDYAYDHLSDQHRYLSQVVKILPVNFPYWLQLSRWLKASGSQGDGEFSYLFDNKNDALQLHSKVGFDMTHFLDNEPLVVRTALLMYLFHWIKQQLSGQLVAIYLDEAWQYLADPYWQQELKRLLPTLRKLNAFLVLATQSPASIFESSISAMILDNCATQIYFPNPQAKDSHYIDNFHLTHAEYSFIRNNTPHCRKFLVKQGVSSSICKLDLSHSPKIISVLSANEKNIRIMDRLRHKYESFEKLLEEYFQIIGVA